jgi:hypothetical protein
VDRFACPVSGEPCREPVSGVEQPSIAGFGGEQDQLTDGDDAAVVTGRPGLDIAYLIGQTKIPAPDDCWPGPRRMVLRPLAGLGGTAMELSTQLFGDLLAFVYHCFDRIVIYGYISGLSRPEQVVHFFRNIVGVATVSKEVLRQRTADYQAWVEAFARNHRLPIEWAEKGVRKEDHVLPWQRRMARQGTCGVCFIFKSMEQGAAFRVTVPKYATKDPNYRILARQRSRFPHYYFYIRDEVLGPIVMRVASFFPVLDLLLPQWPQFHRARAKAGANRLSQDDNAFLAVDDVAALQAAADKLSPDVIRKRLDCWPLILANSSTLLVYDPLG